jgi:ADP-L-glycero-D-manno-heptose 6-epimerase
VRDLARLNLYFAQAGPFAPSNEKPVKIYQAVVNAGSGRARTFNEVVKALISVEGPAEIEYMPFPADLNARYQHFTDADLTALREIGYDIEMTQLEEGVPETLEQCKTLIS